MPVGPAEILDLPPVARSLAILRGMARRCPRCGRGRLFQGYVTQNAQCICCGQDLLSFRADDAPSYFTILVVGHLVVPAMLMVEAAFHPAVMVHLLLWLPLALGLTVLLLPRIKGTLIALQWTLDLRS